MPTRYRFIGTQEDVSGAFKQEIDGDMISRPANWLANATAEDLTTAGIESYEYTPPPPPPPSTDPNDYPLEPFQFFAMLEILGKTDAVNAAIDAIPDAAERAIAKAKFQHVKSFDRNDPLFSTLAPAVGLTNAEIDAAWMQAKDIQ